MFSVERVRSEANIQEIVTKEWTDCKNFQPDWEWFNLYNGSKEAIGHAGVKREDLTVVFQCFALEPLSNQPELRDFFFKGVLGAMSMRGAFFLQAAENCLFLMKEFHFESNMEIEGLLKGSCHHEA